MVPQPERLPVSSVKTDVSGFTAALAKIQNLTPFYVAAGNRLVASALENFRAGGRPARWAPLADATLESLVYSASKRKRGRKAVEKFLRGRKILVSSAELWSSIEYRATRRGVTVGSPLPYASIHQFGGRAGRGRKVNIPARPYVVVQTADEEWMIKRLREHVTG